MKQILNAILCCCITFCLCVPILAYDSISDQTLEKTQDEIEGADCPHRNILPWDKDEDVNMSPDGDDVAVNIESGEPEYQSDFGEDVSSDSPEYFQNATSKSGSYSAEYGTARIKTVGFNLIIQFDWNLVADGNGDFIFDRPAISGFKTSMVKNSAASSVYRDIAITQNYSKYTINQDRLSVTVDVSYTMTFTERRTGKEKTVNYVDSFNIKSSELF